MNYEKAITDALVGHYVIKDDVQIEGGLMLIEYGMSDPIKIALYERKHT